MICRILDYNDLIQSSLPYGGKYMFRIAISYTSDGYASADYIHDQLSSINPSWVIERCPIPGETGNPEFWRSVRTGRLKADVILMLGTSKYVQINENELKSFNIFSEKDRYRFAWILFNNISIPKVKIPFDIGIEVKSESAFIQDTEEATLSQIMEYLHIVSIVTEKDKVIRKDDLKGLKDC